MDEAARMQAIEAATARIREIQEQANEAMNHPRSRSFVDRAREIGYHAGSIPVGMVTGSGILADVAGWFTANRAEDATVVASEIANTVSEARNAAARHEKKLYDHQIAPFFLGRQEA